MDPLQQSLDPGDDNSNHMPEVINDARIESTRSVKKKSHVVQNEKGSGVPVFGSSVLCGAHLIENVDGGI